MSCGPATRKPVAARASGSAGPEQVAGELEPGELVVGHVGVEGADDPVAVGPGVEARHVALEAVALAVAGHVEPVPGVALAVLRTAEQAIDEPLVGVGPRVGDERLHLARATAAGRSGRTRARRISVRRSARGEGASPFASSFARRKRSMGLTAEGRPRVGRRRGRRDRAGATTSRSRRASRSSPGRGRWGRCPSRRPEAIQARSSSFSAAGSGLPGGISSSRMRCQNRLTPRLPGASVFERRRLAAQVELPLGGGAAVTVEAAPGQERGDVAVEVDGRRGGVAASREEQGQRAGSPDETPARDACGSSWRGAAGRHPSIVTDGASMSRGGCEEKPRESHRELLPRAVVGRALEAPTP